MVGWLRPECLLAIVISLSCCSQIVSAKTYDKFWCATEEGRHQLSCPDETALLTDVSIRKVYRRTQMCEPDVHSDYLAHCQDNIDGSLCEGNKTCFIDVSSRNYIQCSSGTFAPTYFFVKYTCTQIHTMCVDTEPIRNTLYGFIVSPAYPHPMADNLQCSINIEADPSMYIELAPVHVNLQDAYKCRYEYLEIFGYMNSVAANATSDRSAVERNGSPVWKSYHLWCGAERSTNNPKPNARYLISSNSLYMSLHTSASKSPRSFKIRYKVVPSIVRSQYNSEGVAVDASSASSAPSASSVLTAITSTSYPPTTIVIPRYDESSSSNQTTNETITKRTYKKEIIIGTIAGAVVLVIAILAGVGTFLLIKRRRTRAPPAKSTPTLPPSSAGGAMKKGIQSPASASSAMSKADPKPSDKAPLLQQKPAASAVKPKLVPERTVQLSDVSTSRFKSSAGSSTNGAASGAAKDTVSANADVAVTSAAPPALKPPLSVADSGIYGADISDDPPSTGKAPDPPKIYGIDLPDKSEATPPAPAASVALNPTRDGSSPTPLHGMPSAVVVPNRLPSRVTADDRAVLLTPLLQAERLDETVKSAYLSLIDATMSETEGPTGDGSLVSSAATSRRTSNAKQPLLGPEARAFEGSPRKTTQFNPLHVILKKDANKYYTTEYI